MRKSTNFNLNLVEGSDLVNPLVQDVPNYETIDEQMYKNECNSIGIATELKSGTVHALTRTIPNAPMFRFKATSNFTAGDTFTVDGIQVSALTPNGETLASNSYIIGSEVLCVLRETLLTVYVSGGAVITAQDSEKLGGQLPEYYGTAEDVTTALTTAQSANQLTLNLQQSVNNINSNLNKIGLKKLWENPSPTSAFAAKLISMDTSDIDYIVIEFGRSINYTSQRSTGIVLKGGGDWIYFLYQVIYYRSIDIIDTGIQISDCNYIPNYGQASSSKDNNCMIPIVIYGGKFTQ